MKMSMDYRWNDAARVKPKYRGEKICVKASFSTTNLTWSDPRSNKGFRCAAGD
jgi:hypothetical protein